MQLARNALSAATLTAPSDRTGTLSFLKQAWQARRDGAERRREARATIAALAELDDAGLADIGLHRSQIASIATAGARGGRR